jgi:exopolysaccharide biosynthesis polyprenyl glycosylphosphotransferase
VTKGEEGVQTREGKPVVETARLPARPVPGVRRRSRLAGRALVVADVGALALAYVIAQVAVAGSGAVLDWPAPALLAAGTGCWLGGAKLYGLFDGDDKRPDHSTVDEVAPVFHLLTAGVWLGVLMVALTRSGDVGLASPALFWLLAIPLVVVGRSCARASVRRRADYLQNTVIIGSGEIDQLLARKFLLHAEYGIHLAGFVDGEERELPGDLDHLAYLGPPDRLPELARLLDVERVVFSFWDESDERTLDLIRALRHQDVKIDIAPRLHDVIGPNAGIHSVEGFPLVGLPGLRLSPSARLVKRALDLVASALGLLVLAPVFALIALLIKLDSRGPVFFRQVRMGAGDRVFSVYKFRTMRVGADEGKAELAHLNAHGVASGDPRLFKIAGDPRVTPVGRLLRRYFLDELPQLINVLKGEMSLVGPRPLILDEDRHVHEWARRRLDLKPGMTGLWQVLGHSAIPFGEMIKLDYLYVTTWSLQNDLALICRTIPVVLRGGGGAY